MPEQHKSLWNPASVGRYLHGKGFFHLLTGNFLGQFLSVAMSLVVAKLITKEELGNLRTLQSYLMFAIPVSAFGANVSLLKFCSEARPEEEKRGIFAYGIRRLGVTALSTAVLFSLLTLGGVVTPSPQIAAWGLVLVWTVPLQNLMDACSWYLQAQKRLVETARLIAAVRGQNFGIAVVSTWIFGIWGFLFGLLGGFLLALFPIARAVGKDSFLAKPYKPERFDSLAFQAWISSSLSVAMIYVDSFLLDHYASSRAQIPDYQMGAIFSLAAMQITSTVQNIAAPYFSERSEDADWVRKRMLSFQAKYAAGSVLIAAVILGGTWLLMQTVFPNYGGAVAFTAVLLLRYVFLASASIVSMALLGRARHEWNAAGSLVGIIVGVAVGLSLLPIWGAIGVAWGQVCSGFATCLVIWIGGLSALGRKSGSMSN